MKNKIDIMPLYDRIIVLPEELPEKSDGGIILSQQKTEDPVYCKIVAVGPGRKLKDGNVKKSIFKVGDLIVIEHHIGAPIHWQGKMYLAMNERDVSGVVEG